MIGEQLLAHWHLEDSNFFFLVKSLVTRFHSRVGYAFVCMTHSSCLMNSQNDLSYYDFLVIRESFSIISGERIVYGVVKPKETNGTAVE